MIHIFIVVMLRVDEINSGLTQEGYEMDEYNELHDSRMAMYDV